MNSKNTVLFAIVFVFAWFLVLTCASCATVPVGQTKNRECDFYQQRALAWGTAGIAGSTAAGLLGGTAGATRTLDAGDTAIVIGSLAIVAGIAGAVGGYASSEYTRLFVARYCPSATTIIINQPTVGDTSGYTTSSPSLQEK